MREIQFIKQHSVYMSKNEVVFRGRLIYCKSEISKSFQKALIIAGKMALKRPFLLQIYVTTKWQTVEMYRYHKMQF